jgi:outer membrane protein OmpA-like peptidoglycan-associated protein
MKTPSHSRTARSPSGARAARPRTAGSRRPSSRFRGRRQQPSSARLVLRAVGAVAVAGLIASAIFLVGRAQGTAPMAGVAAQIIYTAATSEDSALALPDAVKGALRQLGLSEQKVALTRINAVGEPETSIVDLTPRIDGPNSPVLKVPDRAAKAVDAKVADLETTINSRTAETGNRSLFVGLLKTNLAVGKPLWIFSSGLDLSNPVDFRQLAFDVPVSQVVDKASGAGEMPDFGGSPVTFVVTESTGNQPELRKPQKNYRRAVWSALILAGHASSIDFIDAAGGAPSTSTVPAPVVVLPDLPGTPIVPTQKPASPKETTCELSASTYFVPDTAVLEDEAATIADLRDCVSKAGPSTRLALDAWTAYYGPVDAAGKPTTNPAASIALSDARNEAIANLLEGMNINRAAITRMTGHGSENQPYPDPRSGKNRVVLITISSN